MRKIILLVACIYLLIIPACADSTLIYSDYDSQDEGTTITGYFYLRTASGGYNSVGVGSYHSYSSSWTYFETDTFEDFEVYPDEDGYVYYRWVSNDGESVYGSYQLASSEISTVNGHVDWYGKFYDSSEDGFRFSCMGYLYADSYTLAGSQEIINWNQSTYSAGDTANISFEYPSYIESNENFIDIRSYNPESSVWELEERRFISSESGSMLYVVPSYSSRQFRAELMTRASVLFTPTEIGNATMQMTSEGAALEFTKYTYDRDENMTFNYYNMPEGSYIQFHSGTTATGATYYQQYSVSGNGSAGYQLPSNGPYGELFYIRAYDSDDNSLGYDYAYTENAPTGEATLHGRIRDASTEAVISGATVTVAGESTTTDSSGDYTLTINKGTWNIYVSASNYVDKTVSDFTFSGSSYSYNPYLTPSPAASSTLYGSVSAADNGASISQATVTVYNSTKTKSDITSLGAFEINGLADGQSYTIKVTQDYFETYQDTFTFDADNNVLSIELTRKSEEEEEDEEEDEEGGGLSDDDDDSSSSSSDEDYRPGREAARGTLEEAEASVPGMFSVLMIIVFMAAVKKGTK